LEIPEEISGILGFRIDRGFERGAGDGWDFEDDFMDFIDLDAIEDFMDFGWEESFNILYRDSLMSNIT
jgi:hypothetical protein